MMTNDNQHIPAGYKPSPLGPIPEDWEVKRLGEVCTFHNGRAYNQKELLSRGKYRVLRVGNFFTNNSWYYSDLELEEDKYANDGDLLYAWSASFGPRFWNGEKIIYHYHIWKIDSFINISNSYLFSFLFFDASKLTNTLQGGTMVHVTKENMEKRYIPLPPISEQQRIVSVLSLWDTAIEKQTALIENFTLRKRGLMQQLLTGKKRLKGFDGEWEEVKLGNLGKFVGGCVFSENEQGGQTGIPFYKVSDMNLPGNELKMTIANNYVTQEQIERLGYIVIDDEAIIFAKVGAAIALERKRYAKNFIIDNNMLAFIPNEDIWYMKYWFDSIRLSKYIQVGALPSYNASDLSTIKLNIPSRKEQTAIASVLVNADKEIEIQKQKLTVMQTQKKGLMQVLLTGKKRIKTI
jgi:type I restriction enzyme S subunit